MRIVIAGAGEVGTHLAKMLSNEEQDIIVMDPESASAMIDNSKYIKQFDGRNIDMGKITVKRERFPNAKVKASDLSQKIIHID